MATKEKRQRLTSPIGIVCFPSLWEAKAREEGGDPKYSTILVFTKRDGKSVKTQLAELKELCQKAAYEKFGQKEVEALEKKGKFRWPWRDGSEYEEYGEPFTTPHAQFINFSSKDAPGVVDARAKPITDRKEVYAGALGRVTYGVWPYDTKGNKGVTLFLNNFQKAGDGTKLAGRPDAEEDFDELDSGEDEDDDTDI